MNPGSDLPEQGPLRNKIALITGGAQGIGRAIGARFQQAGARVCLVDRDIEMGEATARSLTAFVPANPVEFLRADLERPEEIRSVAEAFRGKFGRIDVLVNNAAIEMDKPVEQIEIAEWDRLQAVNLRAPFHMTQLMLPLFAASGGSVINISSIHSSHAFPNAVAYACSKAALVALTRNLALELGPRGIRVNALCPGYIDTRLWEQYVRSSPDGAALARQVAGLHPLGRRGVPEDVAGAAVFLAGEDAAFITGTQLVLDGGLTVRAHP